jgi:hypothetical protein
VTRILGKSHNFYIIKLLLNDNSLCFIPASDLAALLIMCSVINGSAGWKLCTCRLKIMYTYANWTNTKSMQIWTQDISDDLNLSKTLTAKKHTTEPILIHFMLCEKQRWKQMAMSWKYDLIYTMLSWICTDMLPLWKDPGDQYLCTEGIISALYVCDNWMNRKLSTIPTQKYIILVISRCVQKYSCFLRKKTFKQRTY